MECNEIQRILDNVFLTDNAIIVPHVFEEGKINYYCFSLESGEPFARLSDDPQTFLRLYSKEATIDFYAKIKPSDKIYHTIYSKRN